MKDKKKLCVIVPTHWSAVMGGSEYQVKCLIDKVMLTEQFEIYYLTRSYDHEFHPEGYKIIKVADARGIRRYGFFFDVFRLLKLLHQIQPDVIYQRVGCAYTGIAAYYARQNNCKMVWHIASDNDVLPFQKTNSLKNAHHYTEKKILEYGIRSSHQIIAQTNQQAEYLKRHYGRTPTAVIHNFHPMPRENIKKTNPVKIVWISNFKSLKQPEYFIKLARDLRNLGEKVECIMIGAPAHWDLNWQRSLEKVINEIDRLVYLGARPLEEVNSILAEAHILVNTSLYEGFANTFIQAWMRKVPVVALNVDPDDIIKTQKIGFHSKTVPQMVQDVKILVENKQLRKKMGEKSQEFACKTFSLSNINKLVNSIEQS